MEHSCKDVEEVTDGLDAPDAQSYRWHNSYHYGFVDVYSLTSNTENLMFARDSNNPRIKLL